MAFQHRASGITATRGSRGFRLAASQLGFLQLASLQLASLKALRDRFKPKRWGAVEHGRLYRSGQLHRHLVRKTLHQHRIEVVIDLTGLKPHDPNQLAEQAAIRELGITAYRFPMRGDGTGDLDVVARALATLGASLDAGKTTLVHCAAGSQRTGTIIAIHRLLAQGHCPRAVLAHLRAFGWRPQRDREMLDFVNAHLPYFAERLGRSGAVPEHPHPVPALALGHR